MRRAAARGVFGFGRSKAETIVGLFSGTSRFVEDGTVDFGDNDVVAEARRWSTARKSVEFGLG